MTPVVGLMVKPPPEVSPVSDQVIAPPLTSLADAVMPTAVPAAAPSRTVLAEGLESTGVEGATSLTPMVKVCWLEKLPFLVATTVML